MLIVYASGCLMLFLKSVSAITKIIGGTHCKSLHFEIFRLLALLLYCFLPLAFQFLLNGLVAFHVWWEHLESSEIIFEAHLFMDSPFSLSYFSELGFHPSVLIPTYLQYIGCINFGCINTTPSVEDQNQKIRYKIWNIKPCMKTSWCIPYGWRSWKISSQYQRGIPVLICKQGYFVNFSQ